MTREEALNIIETEAAEHAELSELNSESKVGIWYLIKWIVAEVASFLSKLLDAHKQEVEAIVAAAPYGTVRWYIDRAKEFQLDDDLVVENGKPVYAEIDESTQIIAQVAVVPVDRTLIFKIAKEGTYGLEACSATEVDKFEAYINEIKYPGTQVSVQSYNADLLILEYVIEYSAWLEQSDIQTAVENALNTYVQSILFNGRFDVNEATDQLQNVDGVVNPFFKSASGRGASQLIGDATQFEEYYQAVAGYMVVESFNFTYKPV